VSPEGATIGAFKSPHGLSGDPPPGLITLPEFASIGDLITCFPAWFFHKGLAPHLQRAPAGRKPNDRINADECHCPAFESSAPLTSMTHLRPEALTSFTSLTTGECSASHAEHLLHNLTHRTICRRTAIPCRITHWYHADHPDCNYSPMVLHEVAAEIDSRRPGRPWILFAGIVASLMVIFTGVMISIKAGEECRRRLTRAITLSRISERTQPNHDGTIKKFLHAMIDSPLMEAADAGDRYSVVGSCRTSDRLAHTRCASPVISPPY
jgi:hypothetical protein